MKKLMHNRNFWICFSAAVAFLICFVAAPLFNSANSRQVGVVRVTKEIKENTQITQDMVHMENVGGYNLPTNIVKSVNDVIGKYAVATLEPGDNILDSKVSAQAPDAYLSQLNGKKVAVSVSIKSFAAGLSGKLQAGDIIQLDVADYGEMKETLNPEELRYVKLVAATNSTGVDNTSDNAAKEKSKEEDMPSTLTVLVTPQQELKLVDYENNGKLHAALVYRGIQANAQKFLDMQDQYLNSQSSGGGQSNGK